MRLETSWAQGMKFILFSKSQGVTLSDKSIYLPSTHQHQDKPEQNSRSDDLRHIDAWVSTQTKQRILHPISKIHLFESEAIDWPQKNSRIKPHLVEDKMHEGAKGKDKEPGFSIAAIDKEPSQGDEDEEEQGVAEYLAVAEEKPP